MAVRVYQRTEEMFVQSQGGSDPNPVFPQFNAMDIYPNQYWGSVYRRKERRKYPIIYLENEYLKVGCILGIGGRIWTIYDKLARRHAINKVSGVWSYAGGFGRNYTCGGLEVNYPLAHSPTTRLPREHRIIREKDGSGSVVISEYERKWRTRWSVTYTLRPARAFLEVTVRLYNRTPFDVRCMYWCNCGFPLSDSTEFIFPEEAGCLHGKETTTFSWPIWQGRDMGMIRNVAAPLGLYMLEAQEPYFGYYDHAADFGLAHYADLADLPGKKYWSWGRGFYGRQLVPPTRHPDAVEYGEIQAGRIVIQEHLDRVAPETEQAWTEYWYPVRGTGRFNGAGRDAVIRAELVPDARTPTASRVHIRALGTGHFPDATVEVSCGRRPVARKPISISPESPASVRITLPYRPSADATIFVTVRGSDGAVLSRARIDPPRTRDSWTEVPDPKARTEPAGAEELFLEGETLERDWYRRDARSQYERALEVDPGLSRAHLEIGKLELARGCYDAAVTRLRKACQRDGDSLEIRYFLGLALEFAGDEPAAERMYELACRYDYEARTRLRLAQIKMRQGDFHHALRHLERIRDVAGRLTRPRGLLAACLRHLDRRTDAAEQIKTALEIDPTDPFLRIEAMRNAGGDAERKKLLTQVDNYEPPILEAAFDYGAAGLLDDALFAMGTIPRPGPLAKFYQAWLLQQSGRRSRAAAALAAACRMDPVGHHAWRLEMIPVLDWAVEAMGRHPRPYYHLGNLMMARDRADEALALWRKALRLGDKCHLLYASLGYYDLNVTQDHRAALAYFRKAKKLQPKDLYVTAAVASTLNAMGRHEGTIRLLTAEADSVRRSAVLSYHLLAARLAKRQYRQFDRLCATCNYADNWALPGPQSLWSTRHFTEGLSLMAEGKYQRAIDALLKATDVPGHLTCEPQRPEKNERGFYHVGRCYKKLGQVEKAKQYWRKAVRCENPMTYDPASWYAGWRDRYYQALSYMKLGDTEQANTIFDAMELAAKHFFEIPYPARRDLMNLVARGRLSEEDQKDPAASEALEVATMAEL